mgnify:CR=1 FL=1
MHNSPGFVSFMLQNLKQIFRFIWFSHDILPHSEFIYGFSVFIFSFTIIYSICKRISLIRKLAEQVGCKTVLLTNKSPSATPHPISIKRHSHLQKSGFRFIYCTDFLNISMNTSVTSLLIQLLFQL